MIKKILSLLTLLVLSISLNAQTPFISNFSPEEYKASGQNWAIVQSQQGIMYFANNLGILEYDGSNWKIIHTPVRARSLCIDNTGRIYVGLENDFGYLEADSIGKLCYISLKDKILKKDKTIRQVWSIKVFKNNVIFATNNKLFILQDDSIHVIPGESGFGNDYVVYDHFYIEKSGGGMYSLENDSLRLLADKEKLLPKYIMTMLPYGDEDILVATYSQGIFICNPNKSPYIWKPEGFEAVDDFLVKNKVFTGTLLNNGDFALGSIKNGILVFDKSGKIHARYNKKNGLQSNTTYYLFTDLNGQLWTALQNGISLIMNNLPFLNYTDKDGLDGTVYCVQNFNDKLYVGTSNNLFIRNEENSFERIKGTTGQNFFLLQANKKLLLGNSPKGIFEINEDRISEQSYALKNAPSIVYLSLRKHPNYIITQVWDQGLALIEYKNEEWVFKHLIKGFDKNARYMEEEDNGDIWLNANSVLFKLRLNEALDSVSFIQKYQNDKSHLPTSFVMPYRLNNGEIIFGTNEGIFRYLPDMDYFEPHPDFSMISRFTFPLKQDVKGNIWFEETVENNAAEKGVMRLINGKYEIVKTPFLKFTGSTMPNNFSLYPFSDSLVYFGTNKGLLEYHPDQKVDYDIPFNTLIREVFSKDSLIYGGADASSVYNGPIVLKNKDNDLFFNYSATFYEDSKKNSFSYRLMGSSDTTWSAWTNDPKKEYSNLYEGNYIFEVRSQNIYQKYGHRASFSFKILPPWQRTWLAYLTFGLLTTALVWLLLYVNSLRLKRHNESLKEIVNERTADLFTQKEKLQIQTEKLKASNEDLRISNATKDKFFTIISHDLRSPFNCILGFANLLNNEYDSFDDAEKRKIINSVKKSSQSAYELLDNLLNWAHTQTGRININKETINLKELIEASVTYYKYNASKKNIEIIIDISPDITICTDRNTFMTIIGNLVNNAIKFTHEGGAVTVSSQENGDKFELHIADTGIGISSDVIKKLFMIDENISTAGTNNEKGSGLGLILCKEFIKQNGGEISVKSEVGKGSEFIISISVQDMFRK